MPQAPLDSRRCPTTLIVGSGYVGSALAGALRADGAVVTLRRSAGDTLPAAAADTGATPKAIERAIRADVSRPFDLPALPPLDAVVYLVGADGRTPQAYHDAYEAGPRHLIAALIRAGQQPRRLIYASSISVYGQADGEVVDEASATEPAQFSGRAVLSGERIIAAAPWAATRIRFAGIYGPGRERFLRGVLEGSIGLSAADPHTNRIHRDDCVAVILTVLAATTAPAIVLASDGAPARRNAVIRWIASQAGIEPAQQRAEPGRGASDLGDPAQTMRRVAGDRRCHPGWLLDQGYVHRHPDYRSGYAAALAALRGSHR